MTREEKPLKVPKALAELVEDARTHHDNLYPDDPGKDRAYEALLVVSALAQVGAEVRSMHAALYKARNLERRGEPATAPTDPEADSSGG